MAKRFFVLITLALLAAPALADVELRYIDSASHQTATQVDIHAGRVRIEGPPGSHSVILYEASKHRFLLLDTTRRTYRVVDRQTVEKLRDEIARVQQALGSMPPAIQQMLQNGAPTVSALIQHPLPHVVVTATAARSEQHCKSLTATVDGVAAYRFCAAPAAKLKIPTADANTLTTMAADLRQLAGENLELDGAAQTILLTDHSVPVTVTDLKRHQIATLAATKKQTLSAALFNLPKGYEEKGILGMGYR